MTTSNPTSETFLDEAQLAGKAKEGDNCLGYKTLDEALATFHQIRNQEQIDWYKAHDEEEYPTAVLETYCSDCGEIVPAGQGETKRGRPRVVCGKCHGKKVSRGTHEALVGYYRLEK